MRKLSTIPILVLLLALISGGSLAVAQDQAAIDLVNKAIAAHGGPEAIARVEDSGTAEGKITSYFPARNEAKFKAYKKGDDMRLDIEIAGMKVTMAVVGDGGWIERAGQVADLPELILKQMGQSRAHSTKVLLQAGKPEAQVRAIGEWTLPDGREVPGVEIRAGDGSLTKFYFDSETHLIAKVEFNGENFSTGAMSKFESYPSDYRNVDGFPVAFVTDEYTDGEKTQTMALDTIDLTSQVAASIFDRPQPATLGQRLGKPVTVPMAYVTRDSFAAMDPTELKGKLVIPNEIASQVSINGREAVNCLVDTGAGLTVIDDGYAKRIGLDIGEQLQAGAAGGAVKAHVARVASIKMGEAQVNDAQVLVIDMSMIGEPKGPKLDVVVGYNFLNQFVTQIDYQAQTIAFSDPHEEPALRPGQVAIPMESHGGMPAIKAVLNGSAEITMRVDTGASGTMIPKRTADDLKPEKTVPGGMGMGADRKLIAQTAMLLDSLAFGDLEVKNVPVSFTSAEADGEEPADPTGSTMQTTGLGLLGNDVLSLFRVGIDYERQQLILERVPGVVPSLEPFCKVGIVYDPTADGLKLTQVTEGSSAAEQGLKPGDIVLAINGEKVGRKQPFELAQLFRGPAGTRFKFEVKRGHETFEVEVEKRMLL